MKKKKVAVFILFLVLCVTGCGKKEKDPATDVQWDMEDVKEDPVTEDGGGDSEVTGDGEVKESGGAASSIEGLIEDQSFEVELDGWGKIFFAYMKPAGDGEPPHFALIKDGETVYTFPETGTDAEKKFAAVCAVAFQDYNKDGKKDVAVLVTYSDGQNKWNEPVIFFQKNLDNMFYLEHPELKSYRVDGETEAGPSFYRDTFLEEYLSQQGLTDTMSGLLGSWLEYLDYADSLSGIFSVERQIKIFAENREIWAAGMEYADDIHRFTVAGMTNDGRPVLIVANQGGTGRYTYSEFYKIDDEGKLKKLETSFTEGNSQPDIIVDSMKVYSSFSYTEGIRNYFIVYDELKDSPDTYVYRSSSLSISDDYVLETPLADQRVVYEGEDHPPVITSYDCNGNTLTEDEYDRFPDTYYRNMGLSEATAVFQWIDVSSLDGLGDKEVEDVLTRAYEGFSMN